MKTGKKWRVTKRGGVWFCQFFYVLSNPVRVKLALAFSVQVFFELSIHLILFQLFKKRKGAFLDNCRVATSYDWAQWGERRTEP